MLQLIFEYSQIIIIVVIETAYSIFLIVPFIVMPTVFEHKKEPYGSDVKNIK